MKNIFRKISRAILSRMFPQKETPQYALDRLKICKYCFYNSLNFNEYTKIQKLKLYLNRVLDYIFRVEQFKGVCLEESCGCSIAKKVNYIDEKCGYGKWEEQKTEEGYESIYIPNKK
jgi:hypothetical protein